MSTKVEEASPGYLQLDFEGLTHVCPKDVGRLLEDNSGTKHLVCGEKFKNKLARNSAGV